MGRLARSTQTGVETLAERIVLDEAAKRRRRSFVQEVSHLLEGLNELWRGTGYLDVPGKTRDVQTPRFPTKALVLWSHWLRLPFSGGGVRYRLCLTELNVFPCNTFAFITEWDGGGFGWGSIDPGEVYDELTHDQSAVLLDEIRSLSAVLREVKGRIAPRQTAEQPTV